MDTRQPALVAVLCLLAAGCSDPAADWREAQAENTPAAYEAFLARHPDGEWARRAQAEIDLLREAADWERAQTADAIEAYNAYLLAHPVGTRIGDARQRIYELETEAAWASARAAGSRVAIEDFMIRYADAPQIPEARAVLAALSPPPPAQPAAGPAPAAPARTGKALAKIAPAAGRRSAPGPSGPYRLQFGAFATREAAARAKSHIEQQHGGRTGVLVLLPPPPGGDGLHRVRSAGTSEAQARRTCADLQRSGLECVVVRP